MNLYQDIFFRGLDTLRGRHTIEKLRFLRQSQNWNLDQIRVWQLTKLNELISQAKQNSPFHRQRLADIQFPLKSLKEITNLPILTRADIKKNQQGICCTNISKHRFVESRTGGSTAEPMYYFWDKQGQDWNRATVYRSAEWASTALGERTIVLSGSRYDNSQAQKLKSKITSFMQRYRSLSVSSLTYETLEQYYKFIQTFHPTSLWGYVSGMSTLADFILKNHPNTDLSFIKAIMTSSEILPKEHREKINRAFGGEKIFDQYGSREIYIAAECNKHNGYHIHSEVVFVEVVDSNGNWCKPGETGRVLLTDLSNHAFPFLRYENGDLASLENDEQCSCGMWLPRIKNIQGRVADVLVLKDRIIIAPTIVTILSDMRGIKAYQLRQDKIDEIELILVPDDNYSSDYEKYIRGAIEEMLGGQATLTITHVNEIKIPESGKRQYIVSSISREHF